MEGADVESVPPAMCLQMPGRDLAAPEGKARHKAGIRGKRRGQFVETGARLMARAIRGV